LLVCLSLLAIGAQPEVVDPHQGRAELAVDLGAKHAKDGNDYPFVFETAGASAAVREALDRAAPLGKVVLIGLHPADLPLSILELVRRQLTLQGKLIYDHPRDFADTLSALDHGTLPSRVIGARFTADDAGAAFAQARTVVGKTWIDLSPWHEAG
jgi:alcohol dehydrogenase/L-iditol 2-dehydrogenase